MNITISRFNPISVFSCTIPINQHSSFVHVRLYTAGCKLGLAMCTSARFYLLLLHLFVMSVGVVRVSCMYSMYMLAVYYVCTLVGYMLVCIYI